MNKQDIRNLLADNLPHDNREFLRQMREGEQDDGPYMQAGMMVLDHIMANFVLAQPSGQVSDE